MATAPIPGLPPIPPQLASAITEGKYVELGDLLPAGLQRAFERMRDCKEDTAKKPKKIPVTSITDWAAAFTVYAAVLARAKPAKSCELFAYMSIVFRMARERQDKAWLRYDELFRQAIAVNPEASWGRRDVELWMMATTPTEEEEPIADRGSSRVSSTSARRGPLSPEVCRLWNQGQCWMRDCRRRHACILCLSRNHSGRDCPTLRVPSHRPPPPGTPPDAARERRGSRDRT